MRGAAIAAAVESRAVETATGLAADAIEAAKVMEQRIGVLLRATLSSAALQTIAQRKVVQSSKNEASVM